MPVPDEKGEPNVPGIKLHMISLKLQWFMKTMSLEEKERNDTTALVNSFIGSFEERFKGVHILTTTLSHVRNENPTYIEREICIYPERAQGLERKWAYTITGIKKAFLWQNPILD